MKLNYVICIVAILITAGTALFDCNYWDYEKPIPFSQVSSISFRDFKGLKKPSQNLLGQQEFAFIKSNREIKTISAKQWSIISFFYPSRSYVFNSYIRETNLLEHELYHFYITEYFTRLLKQELLESRTIPSKRVVEELNEKYITLENEMQLLYDDETYHSYVLGEQKKWEARLNDQLKSLEKFAPATISFP